MSWQIGETEIVGGQTRTFFWCDTSDVAFGPMMVDREAAEEVARRAGGDPRAVSLDALDHLYGGLMDERENAQTPDPTEDTDERVEAIRGRLEREYALVSQEGAEQAHEDIRTLLADLERLMEALKHLHAAVRYDGTYSDQPPSVRIAADAARDLLDEMEAQDG